MTTDEQLNRVVRSWLRDTASSPHTASHTVTEVLSRLPSTRQRGRWWPLPFFGGRSGDARGSLDLEAVILEDSPHPIPIVRGRTFTMLSPTKAIIAGALVALGGLFMVAQPLARQEAVVPAAQEAASPAATAIVTQDCVDITASPIVCEWLSSDARLTGMLTHEWVADISAPEPDDAVALGWAPATLESDAGTWRGHLYAVWGAEPASHLFVILSGDGVHEGWHYVGSTIDDGEEMGDSTWSGVIYEGELPPLGLPTDTTGD